MAQRPTADYPIDANTTSGTDLSLILNRFQTALESGNSGSSRPAYIAAGGLWVKEGDPMELYLYDGTTDQLLYDTSNGINVTEGLWTLVDENNEAGQIQRPSDVLIDGNLTVTGDVVDADGNPISIIDPATEDGVIATWNSTDGRWTPDSSLTIDASGNATFSGNIDMPQANGNSISLSMATWDAGIGVPVAYYGMTFANDNLHISTWNDIFFYRGNTATPTLKIEGATGNATFSGTVSANAVWSPKLVMYAGALDPSPIEIFGASAGAAQIRIENQVNNQVMHTRVNDAGAYEWVDTSYQNVVSTITQTGTFNSRRVLADGKRVTTTVDLIETLATLRNATKDETTLEGLRDAIGNAVGGLIEKFEAIQAEAKEKLEEAYNQTGTQEINPDKGTKDDKPEAGTLDLEE